MKNDTNIDHNDNAAESAGLLDLLSKRIEASAPVLIIGQQVLTSNDAQRATKRL